MKRLIHRYRYCTEKHVSSVYIYLFSCEETQAHGGSNLRGKHGFKITLKVSGEIMKSHGERDQKSPKYTLAHASGEFPI